VTGGDLPQPSLHPAQHGTADPLTTPAWQDPAKEHIPVFSAAFHAPRPARITDHLRVTATARVHFRKDHICVRIAVGQVRKVIGQFFGRVRPFGIVHFCRGTRDVSHVIKIISPAKMSKPQTRDLWRTWQWNCICDHDRYLQYLTKAWVAVKVYYFLWSGMKH
jgi:hypothetical protein